MNLLVLKRDDYFIMAGDWNAVLDNNLYKMGEGVPHSTLTKIIGIT